MRASYTLLVSIALALARPAPLSAADMQVQCLRGCVTAESRAAEDRSVNLLVRRDSDAPISLRWFAAESPVSDENEVIRLYAGNPVVADRISDLGPLEFKPSGKRFYAVQEFEPTSLGGSTLVTVMVREHGNKRDIIDWRAFRLLSEEERARELAGPSPGDSFALSLVPVAVRADSSHGPLPPNQGGDKAAWFSLVDSQDSLTDIDLDGEFNGAPGLGMVFSKPWEGGKGADDPAEGLKDALMGVPGHTARLVDLTWVERDPEAVTVSTDAGRQGLELKHYYSVVTVFSQANVRHLKKDDLVRPGLFTSRAFAHETSAQTNSPDDPKVWASYSVRAYGADRELLKLLDAQSDTSIPGMQGVLKTEGDGGATTYSLGMSVRLKPWAVGESAHEATVGLVGVDVVAARVGHGAVKTEGSGGEKGIKKALDGMLRAEGGRKSLDLDAPPKGFQTAPVTAELLTRSGSLALLGSPFAYAQRGDPTEVFPDATGQVEGGTQDRLKKLLSSLATAEPASRKNLLESLGFETEGRFVLSAKLRSGALVELGGLLDRQPLDLVPINAYAQFVLKFTVAMLPGTTLVTTSEAVKTKPDEFDPITNVNQRKGKGLDLGAGTKATIMGVVFAVLGVILLALLFYVPGLRQFLGGWLRFLTPRTRPTASHGEVPESRRMQKKRGDENTGESSRRTGGETGGSKE